MPYFPIAAFCWVEAVTKNSTSIDLLLFCCPPIAKIGLNIWLKNSLNRRKDLSLAPSVCPLLHCSDFCTIPKQMGRNSFCLWMCLKPLSGPRCNYRRAGPDHEHGLLFLSAWLWTWCPPPAFGLWKNNHRFWTKTAPCRARPPSLSCACQSEAKSSSTAAAAARLAPGLPAANPKESSS